MGRGWVRRVRPQADAAEQKENRTDAWQGASPGWGPGVQHGTTAANLMGRTSWKAASDITQQIFMKPHESEGLLKQVFPIPPLCMEDFIAFFFPVE